MYGFIYKEDNGTEWWVRRVEKGKSEVVISRERKSGSHTHFKVSEVASEGGYIDFENIPKEVKEVAREIKSRLNKLWGIEESNESTTKVIINKPSGDIRENRELKEDIKMILQIKERLMATDLALLSRTDLIELARYSKNLSNVSYRLASDIADEELG